MVDRGAYIVQPKLGAEPSINKVLNTIIAPTGKSQNAQLFIRGIAISGAPIINGIIQFAKPAKAGMIARNSMINPCRVVI